MRILHVVPTYLPATRYGGPIYSVHGLCRAQAARGDEPHVFTTNVDGAGVSDVPLGVTVTMDDVRIRYFACGAGRRVYRSPDMARALEQHMDDFDIVHLHSVFLWPIWAAAKAAHIRSRPYVLSPRGMLSPELIHAKSRLVKSVWIALFGRELIANAAAIHVTSEGEKADIQRLGLPNRQCAVIPNGVELPDRLCNAGAADARMVLSLGRISWKKGLDRLICAFAYAPSGELVIAGNDDEALTPKLRALAQSLGLAERVRFVGAIHGAEKFALMQQASLFALASHSENFGNAVLEAMACGVPVVVTPQVGVAEHVASFGAGLVVDGDPSAFGPALASLLADPARRRAFGDAGRDAAQQRFSWPHVAELMNDLYRTALA